MLDNPLIQRYRYAVMRPRQFWVYAAVYIAIVALLLFINYTVYEYQSLFQSSPDFFKSMYYQFLAFQIFVLCIWGTHNCASAIKEEILEKTYDFFRILPLPAHQKALGILVGKNLVVLLLAAINCVFLVFFGLMGNLTFVLQVQIFLALASLTVLLNPLALLWSVNNPVKKKTKTSIVGFVLIVFFVVPVFIKVVTNMSELEELENVSAGFFRMKLPVLLLVTFIALYFTAWTIIGILRKFNREQEPLFSRKGAFLFMLGYELVLWGLFYSHLPEAPPRTCYSYWLISLLPVLIIPAISTRSFEQYLEYSRFVRRQSPSSRNTLLSMLLYSNLSLGLGLFVMWALASVGIVLVTKTPLLPGLHTVWILFTSYFFLLLLLELYVVFNPVSSRIGLLLAFIAAVYLLFPLILSAALDSKIIYLYSPLGFLWNLFDVSHTHAGLHTGRWLVNVLLCTIPVLLVWRRFSHIVTLRGKM
jgi:hypothetical protein